MLRNQAFGEEQSPDSSGWLTQAVWGFVALGVAIRFVRYLLCFPLFCDEAYLAVNFIDRDYLGLLKPLEYAQVCPVLFLWIELTCVKLFGYSEWSLRLFPILCAVASVFLFGHLAAKIIRGVPLLLAVAVFAVSYYPIRHSPEVKPYASDLLLSLALVTLAVEWLQKPEQTRWIWGLALLAPLAIGISHPAVFVAGGVSLALATSVWKQHSVWIPFALYNLLMVGTFVGLFAVVTGSQYAEAVDSSVSAFWDKRFPPLDDPWGLVKWLVINHTGLFFAYPFGDERGASTPVFLCFAVGAWILWRGGDRRVVALLLAPFALNLVAAALHRYPYGGSGRIAQHLAPMICLLAGTGAAALLAQVRSVAARRQGVIGVGAGLAVFGLGLLLVELVCPYKHRFDHDFRNLARYIWSEKGRDAELVCAATDLDETCAKHALLNAVIARPLYLCNQRICRGRPDRLLKKGTGSEQSLTSAAQTRVREVPVPFFNPIQQAPNAPSRSLELGRTSATHPLRCVLFRLKGYAPDQPGTDAWLAKMDLQYDRVGYEKHDMPYFYHITHAHNVLRWEIYEFVPKAIPPGNESELNPALSLTAASEQ